MAHDKHGERNGSGLSRRALFFRGFAYLTTLATGATLKTDPLLAVQRQTRIERSAAHDLVREFLLRKSNPFSAVLGGGVVRPKEIRPAARDTMNAVADRLQLPEGLPEILDAELLEGDSLSFGGPINNEFGRALLGRGSVSPLFSLVEASERAIPPVRFDLSSNAELSCPLIIRDARGREDRITRPGEVIVITAIPDPYQDDARLMNLATRGAVPRAFDPILTNPFLLERLIEGTRDYERNLIGWQVVVPITDRGEVEQELIIPMQVDFVKLRDLLKGKRHLSDPEYLEQLALLGFAVAPSPVPITADRLVVGWAGSSNQISQKGNLSSNTFVAEDGLTASGPDAGDDITEIVPSTGSLDTSPATENKVLNSTPEDATQSLQNPLTDKVYNLDNPPPPLTAAERSYVEELERRVRLRGHPPRIIRELTSSALARALGASKNNRSQRPRRHK